MNANSRDRSSQPAGAVGQEAELLAELDRLRAEVEGLRALRSAAEFYYTHYCQDEAEDDEQDLICPREQAIAACALRDAIRALSGPKGQGSES